MDAERFACVFEAMKGSNFRFSYLRNCILKRNIPYLSLIFNFNILTTGLIGQLKKIFFFSNLLKNIDSKGRIIKGNNEGKCAAKSLRMSYS